MQARRPLLAGALLILLNFGAALAGPPEPPPDLWTRRELLGVPGGPHDWLAHHGIDVTAWVTQFPQGLVAGDGDHEWQYGGRGDLYVMADLARLGLWRGLSLTAHGEGVFGNDVNFAGDGSLLPINTAMAFPRLLGGDADLSSLHFTQKLPRGIAVTVGKIDMLDVASKTPLMAGGGIIGFQNLAFAAPPSGLVPPAILGALLAVPVEPVKLTFGIYDPVNAMGKTGLEDPFAEGVTGLLSVTVPLSIGGLPGFHSLSGKANNKAGLDIDDLGGLLLPPEAEFVLGEERGAWNVTYSFQQYLYRTDDRGGGWGLFGQIGRSDSNPTPLDWFGYVGVGGTGVVPTRPADRFGAGFFYLSLSDDLIDGLRPLAALTGDSALLVEDEMGGELFYDAAITGWFHVAADLQVIDTHLVEKRTAVVMGFRVRLVL